MRLTFSDAKRTLMHLFVFTILHRENWFQYVRRVYATAINFPCIITLRQTQVPGSPILPGLFISRNNIKDKTSVDTTGDPKGA